MTASGLAIFCAVYLIAAMTPGPGILALVSRVLVKGSRGIPAFMLGFVIGDLVWFTIAATGLALLAQTLEWVFLIIKYSGAAFLLYLAYRFWTAPAVLPDANDRVPEENPWQLFFGGLALTLGNPKVVIFFMALLPSVVDLQNLSIYGFIQVALVMVVCLTSVLSGYSIAAANVRRLLATPRVMKMVNRGSSLMLAGAAAAVASR